MTAVEASTGTSTDESPPPAPSLPAGRARRDLTPYLLSLPAVVVLAAMLGWPLVKMIMLSFQDLTLRQLFSGESPPWVGFDNYVEAFTDEFFWTVVIRTVWVAAACVILSVGIGLLLALLMRRVSFSVRITMTVALMLVWAMPQLVATQVFFWMFDSDFGVLNWLIDRLPGVTFSNHSWFADSAQGWTVIIALVVWGAIPFIAISLYAGMTQVPRELIEAAVVDGASSWDVFRNVIFPILRPLVGILTTLSIIWDMGLFTQVWVMRQAKPEKEYYTLAVYQYVEGFGKSNYSLGSAIAISTVVLMLGVAVVYVRQMFKIGDAD
jgi:N,N'-diacetylchitobiose transport system permease protein